MNQIAGNQTHNSQNFVAEDIDDQKGPFETLLSQEQFKQLQKFLPVGYSLAISNKNSRLSYKKMSPKDLLREESNLSKSNIERQKRKAYREAEQTIKGTGEFVKKCKTIIDLLKKHHFVEPFLRPVDPIALRIPDYLEIIKEPMDLSTVNRKLAEDLYVDQEGFEADMRKIWSNALTYNLPGTQIYSMTEEIRNYFERLLTEENPRPEVTNPLKTQVAKLTKRVSDYEAPNLTRFKSSNSVSKGLADKHLTYAEKKNLSQMIRQLPSECLWDVWKIVAPNNENHGNEELEFDIDTLPAKTARELEAFVRNKVSLLNRKKPNTKRVGSTNEFNLPGSYSNLGNRPEVITAPLPGVSANIASYEQLPGEMPSKGKQNDRKEGGVDQDESSFISSLEDSDY